MKTVQFHKDKLPSAALDAKLNDARIATWRAVALARAGRADEAREQIGPALRLLREQERRNVDDQGLPLMIAQALYAAALADPAQARPLLAEARTLTKSLTPDMQTARSNRWWIERISEAR